MGRWGRNLLSVVALGCSRAMDFTPQKNTALLNYLRRHVDGEVRFDSTTRQLYSTDASIYQIEPLGVVIPKTTVALEAAVQIALEMHVPIVPRGGGTSLSGQSIGAGIVLDCSKYLNNILDIDPQQRSARVQPGVILDQLNRALDAHSLMFGPPVATASRANLGGMILPGSPADFGKLVADETEKWAKVIRAANIKPD